jgi:uncharacterized membrane protein YgcG
MLPSLLIVMCVIGVAVFLIVYFGKSGSSRTRKAEAIKPVRKIGNVNKFAPWPQVKLPEALGVPQGHPARTAAERLELSLDEHFESRVKDRVLKGYTRLADREWEWTWFELKRYFLMCGIVRGVPMYSSQADELWHEMLMFTREYEQFCEKFCGAMIHHAPHADGAKPNPDDRAWFDWIYGELFTSSPVSGRVWGAFYRTPMTGARLQELASASDEDMLGKWFNTRSAERFGDLGATVHYLIQRAKLQLDAVKRKEKPDPAGNDGADAYNPALSGVGLLSGMLVYHSMMNPADFRLEMDRIQTEEQRKDNGSGTSASSCDGSYADDWETGHDGDAGHGGHDGGGDSGGGGSDGGSSSCGSSCGGGCSS